MKKITVLLLCIVLIFTSLCACGKKGFIGGGGGGGYVPSAVPGTENPYRKQKNPMPEYATAGYCGNNATWSLNKESGVLTIEGTGPMWDFAISNYSGDSVAIYFENNAPWFSVMEYGDTIGKIIISEGITHIGDNAFTWYTSINCTDVVLPSTLVSIGDEAFAYDYALENIVFPESLRYIGNGAFRGCSQLSDVVLPSLFEVIGDGAFEGCRMIKSFVIGANVKYFGLGALGGCSELSELIVDAANTNYTLVGNALYNSDMTVLNLILPTTEEKVFTVPETVTVIGDYAFSDCGMTEITIPSSVRYIGGCAFQNNSLSDIILPEGLEEIGAMCFYFAGDNIAISIPASMRTMAFNAFDTAGSIEISDMNPYFSAFENVIFNKNKTQLYYAVNPTEEYRIPETVSVVDINAFADKYFKKLTIPESVKKIDGSFNYTDCEEIVYEGSFEQFCNICTSTYADKYTFLKQDPDDGSQRVILGEGGNVMFKFKNGQITILGFGSLPSNENGFLSDGGWIDSHRYDAVRIEVKEGITSLPKGTFSLLEDVVSIKLPESLYSVGEDTFLRCSSLKSLYIPSKLFDFNGNAGLEECYSLEKIEVSPDNAYFVSENGILYNHEKTQIIAYPANKAGASYTAPATIEEICENAFSGNGHIKVADFSQSNVKTIGDGAFKDCFSLESAIIETAETVSAGAFMNCSALKDITFIGNLTEIGDSAFEHSGLVTIGIPESVTKIEKNAFGFCHDLKTISFGGTERSWKKLGLTADDINGAEVVFGNN